MRTQGRSKPSGRLSRCVIDVVVIVVVASEAFIIPACCGAPLWARPSATTSLLFFAGRIVVQATQPAPDGHVGTRDSGEGILGRPTATRILGSG